MELHGKYTFFAEGCRGQLGRQLEERFARKDAARRCTASA
jgi:electron-transferring-flavoprotein dehydrogenase